MGKEIIKHTQDDSKTLFCIMGRTGVGKSYLAKRMVELSKNTDHPLRVLKSYTTRPPRLNELNDTADHIFITESEVEQLAKEDFITATVIKDNIYFSTKQQIYENDIYVIDPIGLAKLQQAKLPNMDIVTVYVTSSRAQRIRRFLQRDDATIHDFNARDVAEDTQFSLFEATGKPDIVIVNDRNDTYAQDKLYQYIQLYR